MLKDFSHFNSSNLSKQPPRGVPRKRCSEKMQQIYSRRPMPKCDFNKVVCNVIEITLRYGRSPVNLLNIFRTPFLKNTCGWLLFKLLFSFPSFPVAFLTKAYNCKHSSSIFVISFLVEQFHFLITWFCSLRRVSIQIPN